MTVSMILLDSLETKVNGLLKIPLDNLPLPLDFINRHPILIYLPPLQFGGNHRHPRREIFLSLSDDLELQWIDENGIKHIKKMKENNQVYLFDIPPFMPHAIVNVSKDSPAILLEWANSHQYDVEPYSVYSDRTLSA